MRLGEQGLLDELEVAIRGWNSQVTAAHLHLSVQMAGIQEQVFVLFRDAATRRAEKPPMPCPDENPSAAAGLNGGRDQEQKRVSQSERARMLEFGDLRRETWLEDVAADPALAEALRDRDEAHSAIVSLRAEVDMLRRANTELGLQEQPPAEPVAEPNATTSPPNATTSPPDAPAAQPSLPASQADLPASQVDLPASQPDLPASQADLPASQPDEIQVYDAEGRKQRMGEILVGLGAITEDQLKLSLDEQAAGQHRRLGVILVEKGFTTEELVAKTLASQLDLPFVRLTSDAVSEGAPRIIAAAFAKRRMCVPVTVTPDRVVLAMANPFDLIAIEDVELASHRRVEAVVATPSDVEAAFSLFYGAS